MDYGTAKKTCAKRALYLRQEKHMSRELLAEKLSVYPSYIYRLEHGRGVSVMLLLKYCDYFGVTLDWLFDMGGDGGDALWWWRT